MAKKYLRIANRNPASAGGYFPRRLLKVMGATTNRKKKDTDHGASQFGSGKKLAPVAALNLGMEVHLTSHDAHGSYYFTYGSQTDLTMGEPQELLTMKSLDGHVETTDICMHSAKNWGDPIGDDPVREFHVFREYMQDAYSIDPACPPPEVTELPYPAVSGTTSVYMSYTDGLAHILKHSVRYLKYLSKAQALFEAKGVGKIYPKSEAGMTRIFGRDQLASCSKSSSESSVFDYSLERLSLMSEDRSFRSMYQVKRQLGVMLASIPSQDLVRKLIDEIMAGRGCLESAALQTLNSSVAHQGLKAWKDAFQSFSADKDVVMSCFVHMKDEYARHSCGKEVVSVHDYGLQKVLRLSGVPYASDFYPEHQKNAGKVVPTPERKRILDKVLHMLSRWGFIHPEFETFVYRPITEEEGSNPDLGYCIVSGPSKGAYLLERMVDHLRDALETGYHEHVHARTDGALDGSRKFDDRKDTDMGRMLEIAERLLEMLIATGMSEEDILLELDDLIREDEEDEEEETIVLKDEDIDAFFADHDTNPGVSSETQKSLDLIEKAIDEAKPEEPD